MQGVVELSAEDLGLSSARLVRVVHYLGEHFLGFGDLELGPEEVLAGS